jgi:hypothetical protein
MRNEVKNLIHEAAEAHALEYGEQLCKILRQFGKGEAPNPNVPILTLAQQVEREISYAASRLEGLVEEAEGRLNEVKRRLADNEISCLNSCGILQGLPHDIDEQVTKLHLLETIRKFASKEITGPDEQ